MRPFRLATVERLRTRQLETRAQELHAAGAQLELAVRERDRLLERLAGGGAGGGARTGSELDLANNFRQVLRQEIEDLTVRIEGLAADLGRAREAWSTARGDLRAVQALHERHRLAARAGQVRLDQRELDEHAGRRPPTEPEPGPGSGLEPGLEPGPGSTDTEHESTNTEVGVP